MKKTLIGISVLALLIVVAAVMMLGSLDSIVETAIEETGSKTIKSKVQLDSAKIQLVDAKGSLNGLSIANPSGFSNHHALKIGTISLTLDPENSTTDTIVIKEVVINQPVINYEPGSNGSNFDAISRNSKSGSAQTADESANSPRIIIDNLYIRNGTVAVVSELLGDKKLQAPLSDIHLRNIGKRGGGATPEEIARQIIASLTRNIGSAVSTLNLGDLKQIGSALQEGTGEATDVVKDSVEGTTEKLKGMFK